MDQKELIKMSGFLRMELFVLEIALIFVLIVFMVFLFKFIAFIDYLITTTNNKTILRIVSVINATITVVLVFATIVCIDKERRTLEIESFSNEMSRYMPDDHPWYVDTSKLDAIPMAGCCGFTSPSDCSSSNEGAYPNCCCGTGFNRCRVEQVYKEHCNERLIYFQKVVIACLYTYMVVTFLLSVISGLMAFFSSGRGRGVDSRRRYRGLTSLISNPFNNPSRPPLKMSMRTQLFKDRIKRFFNKCKHQH